MAASTETANVTLARNPYLALLQTCDCEGSDRLAGAQLWWMAVRPCVFPMSLMSVLIGVLLAVPSGPFGVREALLAALVVIGAVAAHAGNNLLNDYIDVHEGIDREGYFRTEYAPHPILSGQLTAKQVLFGAAVVHAIDAIVLALLIWRRRLGRRLVRARRAVPLGRVRDAAVLLQAPRPGRAHRRGRLGTADDRRRLLRAARRGARCRRGCCRFRTGSSSAPCWSASTSTSCSQDAPKGVGTLPVRIGAERSKQLVVLLTHLFLISLAALVITGATGPWVLLGAAGAAAPAPAARRLRERAAGAAARGLSGVAAVVCRLRDDVHPHRRRLVRARACC